MTTSALLKLHMQKRRKFSLKYYGVVTDQLFLLLVVFF